MSSLNPGWDDGESLIRGRCILTAHPVKKRKSSVMIKMTEVVKITLKIYVFT